MWSAATSLGVLALMARLASCQIPFGLPYFIPCTGPWYQGGDVCPADAFCWNIGIADWSLCAPCSREPARCQNRPQPPPQQQPPPPPGQQQPNLLSTLDLFAELNCAGGQVTFTSTGTGGFLEGGCNPIGDIFRSVRVQAVGRGCTVEVFTDMNCSAGRAVAQPGQCLNSNGKWMSFSVDNCAR